MPEPVEETVLPISINEEMKTSYLDYAMSVIIGRALPDIRDGKNRFTAAFFLRCK